MAYKGIVLCQFRLCHFQNSLPLSLGDWLHRKPTALLQQNHILEGGIFAKLFQRKDTLKSLDVTNIHHHPGWIFRVALLIVVNVFGVECCRVWISFFDYFGDSGDARRLSITVIVKLIITKLHRVAHIVASLIISDTIPKSRFLRRVFQVFNGKNRRFRFHQPVIPSGFCCHQGTLGTFYSQIICDARS